MWENLTWTLSKPHSTTFKIVGLSAVLGLLYAAWRLCSFLGSRTVSKSNSRSLPFPVELSKKTTATLPAGIKQEQVDEIIGLFTSNYRLFESGTHLTKPGTTATQPVIHLADLTKSCEIPREPGRGKTQATFFSICTYLKEQKIIVSCNPTRDYQYQFTLHEEFIQKLKDDTKS